MPREIPDCPTDWKKPEPAGGRSYDIELITPLFGGGVETRVTDRSFPIRPTSIRGQLQFWWRATVGAQFATLKELRDAQTEIWGNTEKASSVHIRVENVRSAEPIRCGKYENDHKQPGTFRSMLTWYTLFHNTSLPYVLFPFQGQTAKGRKQIEIEPAPFISQASFRLTLICPEKLWSQLEPAVWAWVNFGGLGSRTRRGCGSLLCKALAPRDIDDFAETAKRYVPTKYPTRDWPTIQPNMILRSIEQPSHPVQAWDKVIRLFRDFRQGEEQGRNRGQQPNRPGRSRFPEPETIRRVTGPHSGKHGRLPHIPNNAFPRAEFGLPIVFHFQGQNEGEPDDTVLYPCNDTKGNKRERMASPLILKPLALQSGKAIPIILRLQVPLLQGVDFRKTKPESSLPLPPNTVIRDASLSSYHQSPLSRSANGSALEAFLATASANGYKEVI